MSVMTLRAYARHRGVSLAAVQKAIVTGRIRTTAAGKIDSDQADRDWASNTEAQAPHKPPVAGGIEDDIGAVGYTRARAVREHYQARLAKIDYEERTGKLVSGADVQLAAFNKYRQFRDAMINIPDRVAAILAAETAEAKVHSVLSAEIRLALNEFADANNG